ncbi:MAG: glycosyltransferase, partial [Planctomycetaceae bacterium]
MTQRILYLIPTLDQSGAEKQLTLLASGLPRDEFTPLVATLTRGGCYAATLENAGVETLHIGKRWKFDPVAAWRLRRLIERVQPDLLHTWLFAANSYGRLVSPARLPIVVSERCVDSWKTGWQTVLDRRLAGRARRLVANSQSVAEFYRKLGFPQQRLRVIPNGIPTPLPAERPDIRREFDIPPDAPVIGCVGRLAAQKRLPDLIWAMQLLQQLRP